MGPGASLSSSKNVKEQPIGDEQIDVIKMGQDMRTYIMVKNVPNTYT
jgi:hypothetical protein